MNITKDKITEIFYITDEFCKNFKNSIETHLIGNTPKKQPIMTESEVITLMILFYMGAFKTIKNFYICYVKGHLKSEFPNTVSYNRFTRVDAKCCFTPDNNDENMLFRRVYRHLFYRFYTH